MTTRVTFLDEVAQALCAQHKVEELARLCVLFPNRRSAFFFQRALGRCLKKPIWAPQIHSIEDFLYKRYQYEKPTRMLLLLLLHEVVQNFDLGAEIRKEYFQIGECMLNDFDELDKHRVDIRQFYREITNIKDLEARFEMEEGEGLRIAQSFWRHFERSTPNQALFLRFWRALPSLYVAFQKRLEEKKWAYPGMMYRRAAAQKELFFNENEIPVFVGFHRLNPCERLWMEACLRHQKAYLFWDLDAYYMNDKHHSAGYFLQRYATKGRLASSFSRPYPEHFANQNITIVVASSATAQIKDISLYLQTYSRENKDATIALVLPREEHLYALLHALPKAIKDKLNITMGYGLSKTPFESLFRLLVILWCRNDAHRDLISSWWQHPYIYAAYDTEIQAKLEWLNGDQRQHIPIAEIKDQDPLLKRFMQDEDDSLFNRIRLFIEAIYSRLKDQCDQLELHFFKTLLSELEHLTEHGASLPTRHLDESGKRHILQAFLGASQVPFVGEPVRPIQIMGLWETRNLDFDLVILLDVNEGTWPRRHSHRSLIPYDLRRAYQLNTYQQDNASSSYLFYRLLQRAKQAHIYTLANTDESIGRGEASRLIQQLKNEAPSTIQLSEKYLAPTFDFSKTRQITPPSSIEKTPKVLEHIRQITHHSLSDLSDYMDCPIRWYYKKILKLKPPQDSTNYAQNFGKCFHASIEALYEPLCSSLHAPRNLTQNDLENQKKRIHAIVEQQIYTHTRQKPPLGGEMLLMKKALEKSLKSLINTDIKRLPFALIALEEEIEYTLKRTNTPPVRLKGRIDRIMRKDACIEIMDYKTSRLDGSITFSPKTLREPGKHHVSKEARQVSLYAFVYGRTKAEKQSIKALLWTGKHQVDSSGIHVVGLQKTDTEDVSHQFDAIEDALGEAFNDLCDAQVPFEPTTTPSLCRYCNYKQLCHGERLIE